MELDDIFSMEINDETREVVSDILYKWVDYILEDGKRVLFMDSHDSVSRNMSVEVMFPVKDDI